MKKLMKKAGLALGVVALTVAALPQKVLAGQSLSAILDPSDGIALRDFEDIVPTIVNIIFVVAAGLVFFYLVFGAISWITSGGDKGKVEAARNKITAAVIGMLILASVWALFTLLLQVFFGGDLTIQEFVTAVNT